MNTATHTVDRGRYRPGRGDRRRLRVGAAVPAPARRGGPAVGDRVRREVRCRPRGASAGPDPPRLRRHPRPEALNSIGGLAALYNALLDQLDLQDVTVIGNSIGGWITAEIALLKSPRVSGIVLIDAVGIEVPGHPVADFFSLTMDQVFAAQLPQPRAVPHRPATLPPAAQAIAAGNRAAISVYAGAADDRSDPRRASRNARDPHPGAVGRQRRDRRRRLRARLRRRDPHGPVPAAARDRALPAAGDPDQVIHAIWDSADTDFSAFAR